MREKNFAEKNLEGEKIGGISKKKSGEKMGGIFPEMAPQAPKILKNPYFAEKNLVEILKKSGGKFGGIFKHQIFLPKVFLTQSFCPSGIFPQK